MADGCAELLFVYRGSFLEAGVDPKTATIPSGFYAQSDRFRDFVSYAPFGIFGVYVYPSLFPVLSSLPSYEANRRILTFEEILGRTGVLWEERVCSAEDDLERIRIVTEFIRRAVSEKETLKTLRMGAAARTVSDRSGNLPIDDLVSGFSRSSRQFERDFKEIVGFSPKFYSRLARFQSVLELGNRRTLTELAQNSGYYDQSHFIREFREFSGYLPKDFFSGKTEQPVADPTPME